MAKEFGLIRGSWEYGKEFSNHRADLDFRKANSSYSEKWVKNKWRQRDLLRGYRCLEKKTMKPYTRQSREAGKTWLDCRFERTGDLTYWQGECKVWKKGRNPKFWREQNLEIKPIWARSSSLKSSLIMGKIWVSSEKRYEAVGLHTVIWPLPCLSLISSSTVFSGELCASAISWLLVVPPPDEALVLSGLTDAVYWTWNIRPELHVVQVTSLLKCLLLREVFLSPIPLAFFISLWIFRYLKLHYFSVLCLPQ